MLTVSAANAISVHTTGGHPDSRTAVVARAERERAERERA
jgi:hypothetical protein